MTQQTSPFLDVKFGWALGESNWNFGMDENLLKFSFLFDKNIDSIVSTLPAIVNGETHFLTTDNKLYFAVNNTYYSSPTPKWFVVQLRGTGQTYQFDGTTLNLVDSISQTDSRLDAVELSLTQKEPNLPVSGDATKFLNGTKTFSTIPSPSVIYTASGTGAVARTLNTRLGETVSAKDFGAVGDGVVDDTVALQKVFDAVPASGGSIYFPPGYYKITSALVLPNAPIKISGAGISQTVILQSGANQDGLRFSATGTNTIVGNGTVYKTFEVRDLSIMRNGTNGGRGISAAWLPMTNNQTLFLANNVQIYNFNNGGQNWATGIYLFNANGTIIDKCHIKGNVFDTNLTTENPYSMESGIEYASDGTLGQIDHIVNETVVGCVSNGIKVTGWYEGFFVDKCAFVQVHRGCYLIGDAVKQNPDFMLSNTHVDCRYRAVDATNIFKVKVINCDLFKAGHSTAAGFAGTLVALSNCQQASVIGNNLSTIDTILPVGVDIGANSFSTIVSANHAHNCVFGVRTSSTNNIIGNNSFTLCTTGLQLQAVGNTVGTNVFANCTTNFSDTSAGGNAVAPVEYLTTRSVTFASGLTEQIVTVPIPTGIFDTVPLTGFIAPDFVSGLFIVFVYDRASSSTTSAVFRIREYQAASIGAGTYNFQVRIGGRVK